MPKTRIGVVQYLNAQPLVFGLDRERSVRLVSATPAELSDRLKKKEVDVALISSIECFRNPEFRILPEIGVCSEGPIKSIKLYCRKEDLRQVRRVALDRSSRTAATLTRLLFLEFLGQPETEFVTIEPTLEPDAVDADAVLLIGDTALRADPGETQVFDLGAYWTEKTGLPFVYAVWACRKGTSVDSLLPLLLKARDRGLPQRYRIAQAAAKELDLPVAGLVQYLTRNLRYQLGEREIKGLERFRDLCFERELCKKHDVPFVGSRVQAV